MKTESKAPASAVECAREIADALNRYFTPDTPEAWQQAAIADTPQNVLKRWAITAVISAFQKVAPSILSAHTASAVAEAREMALEEAAQDCAQYRSSPGVVFGPEMNAGVDFAAKVMEQRIRALKGKREGV